MPTWKHWKQMTAVTGTLHQPATATVELNGVGPEERLTPSLARRAALVAFGHADGVTVWDHEHGHGYRVYARSTRKLRLSED